MVGVDPELKGIKMCLRNSMKKFEAHPSAKPEIEIARAFERPGCSYLNRSAANLPIDPYLLILGDRPLVMLLEDTGVRQDAFMTLQEEAIANTRTIHDSIEHTCRILKRHNLGTAFRLHVVLKRLSDLNLDFKHRNPQKRIDSAFLTRARYCAMNAVLRDIKHSARIPVPNAYSLVGVADEGPTYLGKEGYEDVYCLPEGKVYGTSL